MKSGFWKPVTLLKLLTRREEGQDLVEYALVLALVGLGGFAGIEALAKGILALFVGVISVIQVNIT